MISFDEQEFKKRTKVLKAALIVESGVSMCLGLLLGIDLNTSKTLGNKSTSIPLNIKIDLLTDINSMDKDDAKKFSYFMPIRNQFMHNISATSFEYCINYIDGLGNKLLKLYPQDESLSDEEKYENCFQALFEDLMMILKKLGRKIKEKISLEAFNKTNEIAVQIFMRSINEMTTHIDEFFEKQLSDKKDITYDSIKDFGKHLKTAIYYRATKLLNDSAISGEVEKEYPRHLGEYQDYPVIVGRNKTIHYVKYLDNISDKTVLIPKTMNPLFLSLEEAIDLLDF